MARTKGSFSLGGTLEILADAPADARLQVTQKSDLTASGSFPYKYVGMIVSVADEEKAYMLIGSDTTDISNWQELGAGGGADLSAVAPEFSAEKSYTRGDIVRYNGKFYAMKGEYGPAQWDASYAEGPHDSVVELLQTQMLRTPIVAGSVVRGDLENTVGTVSTLVENLGANAYSQMDATTTSVDSTDLIPLLDVSQLNARKKATVSNVMAANAMPAADMSEIITPLPAPTASGQRPVQYSTSELVVGQWLDGKTLYQKSIIVEGPFTSSTTAIQRKLVDIGAIVETGANVSLVMEGDWIENGNHYHSWLPAYTQPSPAQMIFAYIFTNSSYDKNKVAIDTFGNVSFIQRVVVTVQYTKVT